MTLALLILLSGRAFVWCDQAPRQVVCQVTAEEGYSLGWAKFQNMRQARNSKWFAQFNRPVVFLGLNYRENPEFMRAQQRACNEEADQCLPGMRQR